MEPDHHDPFHEGTQRTIERLMALGVLIEAGSRLAAENARSKANQAEQELRERERREQETEKKQREATKEARQQQRLAAAEASRRSREWAQLASDDQRLHDYLGSLPFQEVARHWGQAARHADSNPTAATVMAAAENDLRRRWPHLMDLYRRQRADGVAAPEAMAHAARDAWHGNGPARRHGGRPPAAGALPLISDELDAEISRLAGTLDQVTRARLMNNLEDAGWSAESLAYVETLLERAEVEHRNAAATAATPDDPGTRVNEHDAARAGAAAANGRGDHYAADAADAETANGAAAKLAAQSFPVPARQALTAHPAATPARGPANRQTPRKTR